MPARRSWLLAALALKVALGGPTSAQPPAPATANVELPEGAVARLGQTRLRHAERPNCVAFAPDGKTFVTGGEDGTVRAWSVATGEQVRLAQKPARSVEALRFTHGGTRLAVHYATEGTIRLLDPETLREVGSVAFPHSQRFVFSSDGKLVATSDAVGNVVVTEVEADLPKLELSDADVFDFRPDGKAIAVGSAKGGVTVHLLAGGKPTFKFATTGAVLGLAYSPDGRRLAVGTRTTSGVDCVRVYTEGTAEPVAEIEGMNLPAAWLSDDRLAVGNGTDVGVYDLNNKALSGLLKGVPGAFAVSPDGTKVATTGSGGLRVRLWDFATGKQLHAENDTFPDPVLMVGSRDGRSLFLLAGESAFRWPVGAPGARVIGALPGKAMVAAEAGGTLAVATSDAVCVYTNFDPNRPLPERPQITLAKSARAKVVALALDGNTMAWADTSGAVFVTDRADKGRTQLPAVTTSVLALQFSADGTKLAQIGRDGFLRLWSLGDARELWKARLGRGPKATIAFSPDGKLVAAASLAQVPVFNVADGSESFRLERYSEEGAVQHAAFSPDTRLLVFGTSGPGGRVEVRELATRGLVRSFSTGYGGISRLCVFPDGNRVASAGAEEAVTVWEVAQAAKPSDVSLAWAALEAQDAATGYPAIKVLASAGDRGTEVIARGAKEALGTQKKIAGWVADLGSRSFTLREVAAKELLAQGARSLPALQGATRSDDTDVRDRAKELIEKLEARDVTVPAHGLAGDDLRLVRAVQALEQIGTPRAVGTLREMASLGGRPGEEAKATLTRFVKKP